jgi:glycosyltransferase involved in cell wall biosynthesis
VAVMRIGIDGGCWSNRRGFGRFTRGLLPAMFANPRGHSFCLFTDQPRAAEMEWSNVRVVQVPTTRPVTESAVASDRRSLRDVLSFSRAVRREKIDLIFFPAAYSWFPSNFRIPTVVTLHDAIAERFPDLVFPDRIGRFLWSLKIKLACLTASRIITVSETAKREIIDYLGIKGERIDVICEGADPHFIPVTSGERRAATRRKFGIAPEWRLLLFVGGIAPHKNILNLLTGFSEVAEQAPDLRLVIAGDPGGNGFHSNYQEVVTRSENDPRLHGRVHFLGFVGDDDLATLYSDSLALTLPSFSEGFGLPAIEALACGTPVLVSNAVAAAEFAGPAGLVFDPANPSEIGMCILELATNHMTQSRLRQQALKRAQSCSWSRAADLTLTILERCAAGC